MKNFEIPTLYGVGYVGNGPYRITENQIRTKAYRAWGSMLLRCYDEKFHVSNPTYKGCTVAPEWHNFQTFAAWFYANYKEGYQLDKDILHKGNRVYCEARCCLVPKFINCILSARGNARGTLPIGIIYHKVAKKFVAQISVRGKRKHIGSYGTILEAFNSYKIAKERYLREVAEEYKEQLRADVYESLLKYKIESKD
jgi:hypothetical protein